ncbi:tyrosine-type recombinase/integrase [Actinomadura atramentaria]|uniref:tyrosine-type recombinase/integrase n=1 Tax=Actinomadura atramentaria TaxID=1990 RepID=UPI00037012A6|nr:tyrosine-type recombinase/integrase [Actinomadura atramentaria]
MAYVIERESASGDARYTGMYKAANGKYLSAGTFTTHERAIEVAEQAEAHARGLTTETSPAKKAVTTISAFCKTRFPHQLPIGPDTKQSYHYTLKNHILPYIGHLRIMEVERETFHRLLTEVLPGEEGGQQSITTIRAARKVLSSMCQQALDEGYRKNNPIRTIRLEQVPTKLILVANHEQWERLEAGLTYGPSKFYARLNVTSWARQCEMRTFRPCDFDFKEGTLSVTRSAVYLSSKFHPSGKPGWLVKPYPKSGDHRRFGLSKRMCTWAQEHIEEYDIPDDGLMFPNWMFAYRQPASVELALRDVPKGPPIVTPRGLVYEHGTQGAYYTAKCRCLHCKAFAAKYQREWRRKKLGQQVEAPSRNYTWHNNDPMAFLGRDIWGRHWSTARKAAGLPEEFTAYNARHTGISWGIAKGVDLQKVRQRAGHGSLEVTSRYAAILNEKDKSLAESLEEIFDDFDDVAA